MLVGDGSHPLDRQFRVGSPFGIPLYFHIFLLIFVGVWTLSSLFPFRLWRILWPVVLVSSVYLHELGHALSSAHFGARPRRIVLHMFGGVAEVPPSLNPRQELWVIAWGPIVSFVLAVLGFALTFVFKSIDVTLYMLAYSFFQINSILFVFNILPIYPLDGGQFFRQWQVIRKGQSEGIRRSLPLSMAVLILAGMLSLVFNWIGMLGFVIALALLFQNHQEYQRWAHLFTNGFWPYVWPFGGKNRSPRSRNGDRWPGERREEKPPRGGFGDRFFVWRHQKQAELLMRKADEIGLFNLEPKERAILERYLDAKIGIKERKHDIN